MLARGEVTGCDLAQRDGIDVWIPLSHLFPSKAPPSQLERAVAMSRAAVLSFWTALHVNPLRIGLACLLAGCALIIFPRWTFLLFVPPLASAVLAGSILLTRRQIASGVLLSVSALGMPALFLLAGRDDTRISREFPLPPPSIDSVIPKPLPPVFPPKPTPPARFGGLALPQPVKPTPTPRPVPPI